MSSKNFIGLCKRKNLILNTLILSFKNRSGVSELWALKTARARQFWICLTENKVGTVSYVIMTYRFCVVHVHDVQLSLLFCMT